MIKTLIKLGIEGNCLYMIKAIYNELPGNIILKGKNWKLFLVFERLKSVLGVWKSNIQKP